MLPVKPRSLNLSVAMHVLLVLVAFFGLPALLPEHKDPTPLVMSVEVLPIGDISNVKPSEEKIQKEQHAPTPKQPKPMPPAAKEPPKETVKEKPAPKAEPKPAEPEEKLPEEKHFDPNEGKTPKKPEPPKEEPKKDEKKDKPDEFAALLNKLSQENTEKPDKNAKDKANTKENKTKSDAPYDASLPLSISERDAIRSQFVQCWRVPAGSKEGESLAVRIKIELQEDGTVKKAEISSDQAGRYASDTYFKAAADSALRAVHKCSPLQNLPKDKYGSWKEMELNFDPKDML